MEQVRVHGPADARLDDVADPEPGPGDVVVEVAACGVCGTDLKFIALGGLMGPGPEPLALGHEVSGVVDFVGDEVDGLAVGDRVVVNPVNNPANMIGNGGTEGAFTRRLLVRDAAAGDRVLAVPDDMPLDIAALTEPVGVGLHAVDRGQVGAGERVVVVGAGPIGLAAVAAAVDRGASDDVAIDVSPERLDMAMAIGAHAALDANGDPWSTIRERHGAVDTPFGPMTATDVFVECTGVGPVIRQIVDHAGMGARIVVAGLHYEDVPTSFLQILTKELTLSGSRDYPDCFDDALELVGRYDVSPMISHRIPLEHWDEVNELIAGPRSFAKIMVTMA